MSRKNRRFKSLLLTVLSVVLVFLVTLSILKLFDNFMSPKQTETISEPKPNTETETETPAQEVEPEPEVLAEPKKAKILANGDLLIHDVLIWSAYDTASDSFDFTSMFEKIKPLLQSADLTIGNYEGSISTEYALGGYPLFNAPREIADAVKDAGYDVVSLANNHIVDSRGPGIDNTYHTFNDLGVNTIGVNMTADQPILVKEVNGIKIAMLAYAYGFNGMEATLTQEEYDLKLEPIIPEKIKADIEEAEQIADITLVYPHMGIEYMLEPTQEQVDLYHNMIEWGADIVLGNHPHVLQPTEVIQKDGLDKFILYSLGNFLSNQRLETVDDIWTERGVLMELNIVMNPNEPAKIESIVPHPTWVYKGPTDKPTPPNGFLVYEFHVLPAYDYMNYRDDFPLDEATLNRISSAYYEVIDLLKVPDLQGGQ